MQNCPNVFRELMKKQMRGSACTGFYRITIQQCPPLFRMPMNSNKAIPLAVALLYSSIAFEQITIERRVN